MALFSLRDLGMVTPRRLFRNLTFNFGPGDRVGLVAGNGAGKSTLLRCVAGLTEPDEGSVVLSRGASLGYVEAQTRPIGRLSPGQKARLGLLALRLAEPNFYLLDEPTNHIDIPGQEQLESELLAQGATCVLVSHDRSFVQAVGTSFLEIAGGCASELDGGYGRTAGVSTGKPFEREAR